MSGQVFGIAVDRHFATVDALREEAQPPSRFVSDKVIDHVDDLAARFIAAAPLAFLATRGQGYMDVSPRGDPAGFVQVLRPDLIALPDRLGNFRMDSHENLLINPEVGLIFVIPGHTGTLRVSGRAALVRDAGLAAQMEVNGHKPSLIVLISVTRVLNHCPKALVRAGAWVPDRWPDASGVPSTGEMIKVHSNLSDPVEEVDAVVARDGQNRLY